MDIPSKAPKWAIGIAVIIISAFSSFVTSYVAVSPDIRHYIDSKQVLVTKELESNATIVDRSLSSITTVVENNQKALGQMYDVIATMKIEKVALELRVSSLEKDVAVMGANLTACNERLTKCEGAIATANTK